MKLYKNVDLKDLPAILANGLLPISVTGNDNWESGKRSNNSREVVYLFGGVESGVCFPGYGAALVEVDVDGARPSAMSANDYYVGKYDEYICQEVPADRITAVYIPAVFASRVALPDDPRAHWCGLDALCYKNDEKVHADEETLRLFGETAPLNSDCFNFFRGQNKDRTMIDLYNVRYIF